MAEELNDNRDPGDPHAMRPVELSVEQVETYCVGGGTSCPFCGDEDIEGSSFDVDEGTARQEMSCPACGQYWNDVYKLVTIEP